MAAVQTQRSRIQSVERAAAILRLLAGPRRRLGVVELARALGLPKGTIHGILRTLQLHGFVEQDHDSGKYQLGPAPLPMGLAYLQSSRLRAAALNPAYVLASRSGESVQVAMLRDRQVLIIHHLSRPDDGQRALDIGRLAPAHATALGKALLTQRPPLLAELATEGLGRFTPATITDPARLQRVIAEAARRGWASETSPFWR